MREQFSESVRVRRAQREVCKVFIEEDQRYRGIGKLQEGPRLLLIRYAAVKSRGIPFKRRPNVLYWNSDMVNVIELRFLWGNPFCIRVLSG